MSNSILTKRVVITGIGVVSPIGSGEKAFFRGLAEGLSGIDEIRSFDARSFPTRLAGEVTDLEAAAGDLPEREVGELRHVFDPVSKRRDAHDAAPTTKAVEEITAERAFLDHGLQIPIRRHDDANHDLLRPAATDRPNDVGLQHPGKFHLDGEGRLSDLVEDGVSPVADRSRRVARRMHG